MLTLTRHLSDERLAELACGIAPAPGDDRHLAVCAACARRAEEVRGVVQAASASALREADEAFPPARLARQRAAVLRRIGQVTQPTAVLDFPAPQRAPRPAAPRWWLPAAAALLGGVGLGVLAGQMPAGPAPAAAVEASRPAVITRPAPAPQAVPALATISDDELLLQIEAAGAAPRRRALRSLDELTPRVSEVSLR